MALAMGACNTFVSVVEQNQWTGLLSGFVISTSSVRIRLPALSISDFRLAIFNLGRGFADSQAHAHDAKDAVACFQITGRIEMTRPGKIDIDDFLDRGGTIAHDENAIGKLHGFFNVVRNEENGFFSLCQMRTRSAHTFSFAIGFKRNCLLPVSRNDTLTI